MRHYELVVVLSPMISPDEASQAWERIKGFITNREADIVHEERWGTRRLAYPVKKGQYQFLEGNYHLTRFSSDQAFNRELENYLKLDDNVLRSLVTITLSEEELAAHAAQTRAPRPPRPPAGAPPAGGPPGAAPAAVADAPPGVRRLPQPKRPLLPWRLPQPKRPLLPWQTPQPKRPLLPWQTPQPKRPLPPWPTPQPKRPLLLWPRLHPRRQRNQLLLPSQLRRLRKRLLPRPRLLRPRNLNLNSPQSSGDSREQDYRYRQRWSRPGNALYPKRAGCDILQYCFEQKVQNGGWRAARRDRMVQRQCFWPLVRNLQPVSDERAAGVHRGPPPR